MKKFKKPNIPSSFRITPKITYQVLYVDAFENDPTCVGMMKPNEKQIVIKNGQTDIETTKTVIHECLHAIADENNIKLPESQVLKLEAAIFKFLRLNNFL